MVMEHMWVEGKIPWLRNGRPYVRERCAAVLQIADGVSAYAVARQGRLKPRDPDTVYAWLAH